MKHSSNAAAFPVAELRPTTDDNVVTDSSSFRQAVGCEMLLAGITRPEIADPARTVARHSHNPRERYWVAVEKILAYLNATRDLGLTYERGSRLALTVFADADYTSKTTDRRSISGVAMMLGSATVCAIDRTQHCGTLATTEDDYVKTIMSFMQSGVAFSVELFESNERGPSQWRTTPEFRVPWYVQLIIHNTA